MGELVIPRHFHWIWLGERRLPARLAAWIDGWLELHPGWRHTLWTEANRPRLRNERQFRAAANDAQRADVLRYEVMLDHGGVYVDCDFQCCRNIEPLIAGHSAFAGRDHDGYIACGLFGALPDHPWMDAIVNRVPRSFEEEISQVDQGGPGLMTAVTEGRSDVAIFPQATFYPQAWQPSSRRRPAAQCREAYAIHHWEASWLASPAERVMPIGEIDELVPPGAEVLMISATLGPLELPGRVVTHFYPCFKHRPAHPADDQEAIRAFERARTPTLRWVVFHCWAFWWFRAYPQFVAFLEERCTRVERRQWIVAYELEQQRAPVGAPRHLRGAETHRPG
jgi:hypothetical protein